MKKMILMLVLVAMAMATVANARMTKEEKEESDKAYIATTVPQAEKGDVDKQFNLGMFYELKDPAKARFYYEMAVAQGDRRAAKYLNSFNAIQDTIDRVQKQQKEAKK